MGECEIPGCAMSVPYRMFMCRSHWFTVPLSLRDAVSKTRQHWQEQAYQIAPTRGGAIAHDAAKLAAIQAVSEAAERASGISYGGAS
jgi:hypothetical protein